MRTIIRLPAVVVLAFALPLAAVAQSKWEIDPAHLPPGFDRAKAEAILRASDATVKRDDMEEERAMAAQSQRLERAMAPYHQRLRQAITEDTELKAELDRLESQFGDGQAAASNPESIAHKIADFRRRVFAKAGINEREHQNAARSALSGDVRSRGAAPANIEFTPEGGIVITEPATQEPPPGVSFRGVFKSESLSAPFPARQLEQNVQGRQRIDQSAGTYEGRAQVDDSSGTNRAGLAHFATVPRGTLRARVTAQMPNVPYLAKINVSGSIFAEGRARPSSAIRIFNGSGRQLCISRKTHTSISAGWFLLGGIERSGEDSIVIDCTFDAPPAGTDIVIRFTADTYVKEGGINYSVRAEATGRPDNIRVEFIN